MSNCIYDCKLENDTFLFTLAKLLVQKIKNVMLHICSLCGNIKSTVFVFQI